MSKENTVTISIHRYNELRDFETKINKGMFCINHPAHHYGSSYYEYLSKEEFKDKINEDYIANAKLWNKKETELKNQIHELIIKLKKEQGKRRNWWNSKD